MHLSAMPPVIVIDITNWNNFPREWPNSKLIAVFLKLKALISKEKGLDRFSFLRGLP